MTKNVAAVMSLLYFYVIVTMFVMIQIPNLGVLSSSSSPTASLIAAAMVTAATDSDADADSDHTCASTSTTEPHDTTSDDGTTTMTTTTTTTSSEESKERNTEANEPEGMKQHRERQQQKEESEQECEVELSKKVVDDVDFEDDKDGTKLLQAFPDAVNKFNRLWDGDDLENPEEEWTLWYVLEEIGCPSVNFDGPKDSKSYQHIPTADRTFNNMYRTYHQVMNISSSSSSSFLSSLYPSTNSLGHSYKTPFLVETEVRLVPNAGRGVFSTQFIANNTKIWEVSNAAEFPTVDDYYNFLLRLYILDYARYHREHNKDERDGNGGAENDTFVPELVCDAILWSYTVVAGPKEEDGYMICIDFDEGSMVNQADEDHERNAIEGIVDKNDPLSLYGCRRGIMKTIRDVKAGDEIRVMYSDSIDPEGWEKLGLSW